MGVSPDIMQALLSLQNTPQAPGVAGAGAAPAVPVQTPTPIVAPTPTVPQAEAPSTFDFQDPLFRMALLSTGLQALQPVQPGQSQMGHVAQALQGGIGTLNTLREQRRKGGLEERKVSDVEKKTGIYGTSVENQQQQAEAQQELANKQFGVDKMYKTALAGYYNRMPVTGKAGVPDPKDVLDNATKLAKTHWDGLINAGMSSEELLKRHPGGVGSLAQLYANNLYTIMTMRDQNQRDAYLKAQEEYRQKYGIDPVTQLPIPGAAGTTPQTQPRASGVEFTGDVNDILRQAQELEARQAEEKAGQKEAALLDASIKSLADFGREPAKVKGVEYGGSGKVKPTEAAKKLQEIQKLMTENQDKLTPQQQNLLTREIVRISRIATGK